jgi:exosortase D (VPLPA-CTERM-specific)
VFLVFAIPLPRLIYVGLSQDLQLWSSALGVLPLHILGIPVFQDGNIIDLGNARLQVAEACSGLRYLFPLMSFGYLAACLLDDKPWKRAFVFLSTIPIAIGINALRIAIIGISVDLWGSGMAEGLLHEMEGWTLFLICLSILALETWLLLHIGRKGHFRFEYMGFAHGEVTRGRLTTSGPVVAAYILSVLLVPALGAGWIDNRAEITPSHPAFATFPERMGDWSGRPASLERQVLNALQASDYWLADYRKGGQGVPVDFYMAYYNSQRIGTSVHSPSNCLPGSGWVIVNSSLRTLPVPQGGSITLSRLLIKEGGASQLVYYWFDERGRILTEQYGAKWHLLWDSIFMHRTDGALVRLVTPLGPQESEADADKRLEDFFAVVYPQVRTFIPGKNANAAPGRP